MDGHYTKESACAPTNATHVSRLNPIHQYSDTADSDSGLAHMLH